MAREMMRCGWRTVSCFTARRFTVIFLMGVILVALGIRVLIYLSNPPLYVDETFLANNVFGLTYKELCSPLGWGQMAPLGFLMLVKTCVKLFGETEFALRLWPFAASCLGVYLFYRLNEEYLRGMEVIGAMLLFAFSSRHIFYSVDCKPYSTDILATIYAFLLAFDFKKYRRGWLFYGLGGAVLIWFSHPVIFVLAGIGISDFIAQAVTKNKTELKRIMLVLLFWLISFAVNYGVSLAPNKSYSASPTHSWGWFYPQGALFSMGSMKVLAKRTVNLFDYSFGFRVPAFIPVCLCCIGGVRIFLRNKHEGGYLIGPIVIAVGAFFLKQYPLYERLALFLLPILIILMVKGITTIQTPNGHISKLIQMGIFISLLFNPVSRIAQGQIKKSWYIPALSYIQSNAKPYDVVLGVGVIDYYFQRMRFRNAVFKLVQPDRLDDMRDALGKIAKNSDVWIVTRPSGLDKIELAVRENDRSMEIYRFNDFFVYKCRSTAKGV